MEKLIHQNLSSYHDNYPLLANEQDGFRRAHSTVHSIAQLTNYIYKGLDEKVPTLAVFIDFRKAFDCVQHPVLLQKLKAMNLDVSVIDWVQNYLTCRQQRVFSKGPSINYALRGRGGGSSLQYISIAYYMQKGREEVQIACKNGARN